MLCSFPFLLLLLPASRDVLTSPTLAQEARHSVYDTRLGMANAEGQRPVNETEIKGQEDEWSKEYREKRTRPSVDRNPKSIAPELPVGTPARGLWLSLVDARLRPRTNSKTVLYTDRFSSVTLSGHPVVTSSKSLLL